jgi:hypothetical protein
MAHANTHYHPFTLSRHERDLILAVAINVKYVFFLSSRIFRSCSTWRQGCYGNLKCFALHRVANLSISDLMIDDHFHAGGQGHKALIHNDAGYSQVLHVSSELCSMKSDSPHGHESSGSFL